jgi:hypothetical protein
MVICFDIHLVHRGIPAGKDSRAAPPGSGYLRLQTAPVACKDPAAAPRSGALRIERVATPLEDFPVNNATSVYIRDLGSAGWVWYGWEGGRLG